MSRQSRTILSSCCAVRHLTSKGLIYGMGHAVYSISDPRAQVFKSFVGQLAHEKGRDADFALYTMVERDGAPGYRAGTPHL